MATLFVSLVMSMAPPPPPAWAQPDKAEPPAGEQGHGKPWVAPTGDGLVRPDRLSAAVTARASRKDVEVLSERTEFSRTWALPSGEFRSETVAAPVRFKDDGAERDGWRDIDTTLVRKSDGSVAPTAMPQAVVLGGEGAAATDLVSWGEGKRSLKLGAGVPGKLPKPELNGSTAVYPEVLPGVDVTVEVRPTGFEQLWVVKTPEAAERLLAKQGKHGRGVSAPVKITGADVVPQRNGAITVVDSKDKERGRFGAPRVWDAATTSADGAEAEFVVVYGGKEVPAKGKASGELEVAVVPDQDWLSDPDRKFPITIDPTYVSGANQAPVFDTYVKEGVTTDTSTSTYLPAGMGLSGSKHRSFLNFDTTPFVGKTIASATMTLWSDETGTCTANGWSAYDAGLASTSTRWTAQPTIGTKYATSTQTKGFDASCADGLVNIDMKAQVQSWADAAATTKGMALQSDNETAYTYYHLFWSSNAASNQPVLTWTYDRAPGTVAAPLVSPVVSFTPSGSSTPYLYTADRTPNLSAMLGDPDLNTVKATFSASTTNFGSTVSSCTTALVASGTSANCDLGTQLVDDGKYYVRGQAIDQLGMAGSNGPAVELRVAAVTPAAPVVTCPAPYSAGSWATTAPSSDVSCTISAVGTGYSAPSRISVSIDGNPNYKSYSIPQSSSASVAQTTVTIPNTPGGHLITASGVSPTGLYATTRYYVGWGSTALLQRPNAAQARITTTDQVELWANGKGQASPAPTARGQWRVSGATGSTGWADVPAGNTVTTSQTGGQTLAKGWFDTTDVVGQADAAGKVVSATAPTLIDVRVCITLSTGDQCTGQSTILHVVHAFGGNYPVTDAGPGKVALWTGELQVDDSDASLATPTGGLSVSRTHSSFAGTPAVQNKVFGPGWNASFDGGDSGVGGAELTDGTPVDGTLAVVDADGEALVFTTPTGARRTTSTIPTGSYKAADEDTRLSGTTLTVSGSGASTVAEVKGDDGIITKFQVTAAPTTAAATFRTVEIREPAVPGKTTYSYDGAGRVTAMTAALPDGVTTACVPGTPTNGCRVLKIEYATATTAVTGTPGDINGQVKRIVAQVNTDTDRELAAYKYDTGSKLVEAKDSRTGLITTYTWTGTGAGLRLVTITPPGEPAYTFSYDAAVNKLAKVTRPNPSTAGGGTAQLAAYVYGVPTSGAGLPDLTDTSLARWSQAEVPSTGFAVFGPDKPISTTSPGSIAAADWVYADLRYTNGDGTTLNTATYGAGDWQFTASDYDSNGNVIRAWDARALRGIIDGDLPGEGAAAQSATVTVYNNDITDGSGNIITPAGTLVTDVYQPVHEAVAAWTSQQIRKHTKTVYDQGAPNSGINPDTGLPYHLLTKVTETAELVDGTVQETLSRTFTDYDPLVSSDTSGWQLGEPTKVTVDMDLDGTISSGDLSATSRFDQYGRVLEQRQPKSNGSDAGTQVSAYYTGSSSGTAGCTSKPQWAGMTCQVGPAAQPSGQTMPVTKTTGYTWDLQTSTKVDTSGTVTRTTTTTFNAQDRPTAVSTVVANLSGSQSVPSVTTSYDTATGRITGTTSAAGSAAMTYDTWGRQLTYTNTPAGQSADTGTTTYNAVGQVTSVVDGNGQTVYGYDGTDADGKTERRGLVTSVKVKLIGGTEYTSTGAYDGGGRLVTERLPGEIARRHYFDPTGEEIGLSYDGTIIDGGGNPVPDQPWFGWGNRPDGNGNTSWEWTAAGVGTSGALGPNTTRWDRAYEYDPARRLTRVYDNVNDDPCETRSYTFDANGNRTALETGIGPGDGTCTSSGTTVTHAYDTADRPTTGGNGSGSYVYDPLGRQTTLPGADAPTSSLGNITLGYFDSDAIRTIAQGTLGSGGSLTTFTLDGAGRRLGQTTQNDAGTTTLTRHYTDSADNPTWSVDARGTTTTTTRYAELIDGDLGITLTTTGSTTTAALALGTPRGDTATTITLSGGATGPGGSAVLGIDSWNEYTEYGTPRQTVTTTAGGTTGIGYGWLGTKQRATTPDTGLTLMGARLYNPTTGLFTSSDPVSGGNWTAYAYPLDPVNTADLDGRCGPGCAVLGIEAILLLNALRMTLQMVVLILIVLGIYFASRWVITHIRAIPRPGGKTKQVNDSFWGYRIDYYNSSTGHWPVWKYGITSVQKPNKKYPRPESQIPGCSKAKKTVCRYTVLYRTKGYYNARTWEYMKIVKYFAKHKHCPPGQPSCK